MQIDWLTVTAQIVNFLVLVWLLQHFLYGPITRAMERREQRIADRLAEAEKKREAAEQEARSFREKQAELERSREELMEEARAAAAEERRSLEQVARDEVEARKQGWLEQLSAERRGFEEDLRRRTADAFYVLARRALGDLADAELEGRIASAFTRQLSELDDETADKLKKGAESAEGGVTIQSRFPLDSEPKQRLTRAVHERFGDAVDVTYNEVDDLDCGIVLQAGSQQLAWSIEHYLDALERKVDDELARVTADLREDDDG